MRATLIAWRPCPAPCSPSTPRRSCTARSTRCPRRSPARTACRSTRCSASRTSSSRRSRSTTRARSSCASARRRRRTGSSCTPATTPTAPRCPRSSSRQWADAPAYFGAFKWTVVHAPALEADDLLGSLAKLETDAGGTALLFTGDRDMFQCVSGDVAVLWPVGGKGEPEVIGPKEVDDRYGIAPEQVPDFIALRGDPSDGIPGAKGIGEKTARDLLRDHDDARRPHRGGGEAVHGPAAAHPRGPHRRRAGAARLPRDGDPAARSTSRARPTSRRTGRPRRPPPASAA